MSFLEVTKVLCSRSQRGSRGRQQVVNAHNILSDSGALISIVVLQVYLVRASIRAFLQAASFEGHEKVVELLLDRGADVNAQGGYYGNALQAALVRGHEKVVELLLDRGANVNTQGGHYGNALQAALDRSHEMVELPLGKGAVT
jgi:hypothetical protein